MFENWAPNRPNNVDNQDCLELSPRSPVGWNDHDCESPNSFICQKHVNSVSASTTSSTYTTAAPVVG